MKLLFVVLVKALSILRKEYQIGGDMISDRAASTSSQTGYSTAVVRAHVYCL